jgi:hypothetical protein
MQMLHGDRKNGWTYTAAGRRRSSETYTVGGLIGGHHLKVRRDLHHRDRGVKLLQSQDIKAKTLLL